MTFLHAAVEVLRQAERPLSVAEITRTALEAGLIDTMGQTHSQPLASI